MTYRPTLIAAALFLASGCASFNSGDFRISREERRRMLSERVIKPAAEIRVAWDNFPYKNPMDEIGEGRIRPIPPRPVPVPPGDAAWLRSHAERIFGEAGLYDVRAGTGTITISMTSRGRWTYGELFRSFLVDTGWIFILPATLRTSHHMTAEYTGPAGRLEAAADGQTRTTFHALLFPLYPFLPPGAREHSLLKKMLWRSAYDMHLKAVRNSPAAGL